VIEMKAFYIALGLIMFATPAFAWGWGNNGCVNNGIAPVPLPVCGNPYGTFTGSGYANTYTYPGIGGVGISNTNFSNGATMRTYTYPGIGGVGISRTTYSGF
jgi:hypothetical protein